MIRSGGASSCRQIEPHLARLAASDAAPRLALDVARHLGLCVACAETLLRLREMNGLLDRLPRVEVPASFTERVLRALPSKRRLLGGGLVLVVLAGLGAAASTAGSGSSILSRFADPFESTTETIAAALAAVRSLAALAAAAFEASQEAPLRLPGLPLPPPIRVLVLVGLAALAFAGSAAALGGGALRLRRERRSTS
ncbi:MAG: hypothetical protein DMF89_02175 [Acidobacteria bacterium]|nr:MAG: hypothetical protein DMF89_02175 [Acidobacteriota bacterium]